MYDLKGILKAIYAGKKVRVTFDSYIDRESFRQRLYKQKQVQDKALTDVLDEERQVLKCNYSDEVISDGEHITGENISATFWLEDKPKEIYNVEILE